MSKNRKIQYGNYRVGYSKIDSWLGESHVRVTVLDKIAVYAVILEKNVPIVRKLSGEIPAEIQNFVEKDLATYFLPIAAYRHNMKVKRLPNTTVHDKEA